MITNDELVDLGVPAINKRINVWGFPEDMEAEYIRSVLEQIAPHVPVEVRPFLIDAADGLDDSEVTKWSQVTLNLATEAAVTALPLYLQAVAASVVRGTFHILITRLFEFAQAGFALGLTDE